MIPVVLIPVAGYACVFALEIASEPKTIEVRGDCMACAALIYEGQLYEGSITPSDPDAASRDPVPPLMVEVDRAVAVVRDPAVAGQARQVTDRLREALDAFDLAGLPPLRGTEHDDGSFTIEWRFPDRRLAFTIERDPAESGWHLVSSRSSGDVRAYGALSAEDLRPLLAWTLSRVAN